MRPLTSGAGGLCSIFVLIRSLLLDIVNMMRSRRPAGAGRREHPVAARWAQRLARGCGRAASPGQLPGQLLDNPTRCPPNDYPMSTGCRPMPTNADRSFAGNPGKTAPSGVYGPSTALNGPRETRKPDQRGQRGQQITTWTGPRQSISPRRLLSIHRRKPSPIRCHRGRRFLRR